MGLENHFVRATGIYEELHNPLIAGNEILDGRRHRARVRSKRTEAAFRVMGPRDDAHFNLARRLDRNRLPLLGGPDFFTVANVPPAAVACAAK